MTSQTRTERIHMRRTWLWGAIAVLMPVIAGCGAAGGAKEGAPEEFVRVINVEVATLAPEQFVEEIRLTSVAMANQDVMVAAEESGVIRAIYADRGSRVNEGDSIAKIDDRVLSAQVAQARAAAELAAQTWDRRRRLWEVDSIGSEIAYLEARFGAEQSAASLMGLEERLARTVIRAPFAGVLDERFVDVGAMVSPGTPVGRLVDLDPIKVFAGVPERYAGNVRVGDQAVLEFEALDVEPYTARIRYVGATVNAENRTFLIEVSLPNAGGLVKPQMVANMGVTRETVNEAIVVPQDALIRVEDGYVVYVAVDRDGNPVAEVRDVVLGPTRRNLVVIDEGVEVGERLIVVGHKEVEDGDRIRIVGGGA
ncbi:MAG: efflux RND transporter periplasmic adaptor subunit [Gemmatimonadetes bacterium]|nr:efflux RND transporter periplasmic adaptor subunit [Gemmatimonadota bacterium]